MPKSKTVFISKTLSDVFYHIKSVNEIQLLAGCTQLKKIQDKSVSLRMIPELNIIDRKERHIEFGSAVSIANVILTGGQKLPVVLAKALKSIGTEQIKNIGLEADAKKVDLENLLSAIEAENYRRMKNFA